MFRIPFTLLLLETNKFGLFMRGLLGLVSSLDGFPLKINEAVD